jgi:hypothetical protein
VSVISRPVSPWDRPHISSPACAGGFETKYRNFDIQKQKSTLKQAKVTGSEEVTVAAGSFPSWKVELTSAEDEPGTTTLWVDKATRKVVKTSATLPQMGGAVVTVELREMTASAPARSL